MTVEKKEDPKEETANLEKTKKEALFLFIKFYY
jgi:hypothetical protein